MRGISSLVAVLAAASCGRFGFDPVCAPDAPCVVETSINGGAAYALGPRLEVTARISGNAPPFEIRVAEATSDGNCQLADDGWQPYDEAIATPSIVAPTDGVKRLCVWAKDSLGATSTIAPERGLAGINSDEITLAMANPPVVELLEVVNAANGGRTHALGEPMRITWRVSDAEELAEHPIDLEYTTEPLTEAAWLPLASAVGQTDHQTRYEDSTELPAPTAEPFFVRATVRDATGMRGFGAVSEPQNTGGWTVYAGSIDRGIGGHARTARLEGTTNSSRQFAIDPRTHDVYASDHFFGVIRVDAATGTVERIIRDGAPNLPDDGPLTADSTVPRYASLRFGPDGKLYVAYGDYTSQQTTSTVIYQIDPMTRHCRKYLGGGTQNGEGADPAAVFVFPGAWDFDEDSTLYFMTSCTPGTWNAPSPVRILAATQVEGRAGAIRIVGGACATGAPAGPGPFDPLTTPLDIEFPNIGTLVPFDRGRVVYFSFYPGKTRKIVDGSLYSSNIVTAPAGSLVYAPDRGTLFAAENAIVEYAPSLDGADGDALLSTHVATTGQGACTRDGVPAGEACVRAQGAMTVAGGRLYFMDGRGINEARPYRIRFVDGGTVHTYVGMAPFHGEGLDRRVANGMFGGIHYKPASAPNQAAFPAGLYFVEPRALALGAIDPASGLARIEWGNQSGAPAAHATGTAIGPDVSLGVAYVGGNMKLLAFDRAGLPWLRYGPDPSRAHFVRVDNARRVVELQVGTTPWEATPPAPPRAQTLWPYGGVHNLALRDETSLFVLGGYQTYSTAVVIRLLDFANGTTTHVMGASPNGYTPSALPGTVRNATISANCGEDYLNCYAHYRAADDRLYFSEDTRMRYITDPSTPALSTLATLWTNPTAAINNFVFRQDGSQVIYLSRSVLRCHDLSSAAAWCNDAGLGPPAILGQIVNGPDQLTWKDDRTLLISTHKGQILEYVLPP